MFCCRQPNETQSAIRRHTAQLNTGIRDVLGLPTLASGRCDTPTLSLHGFTASRTQIVLEYC